MIVEGNEIVVIYIDCLEDTRGHKLRTRIQLRMAECKAHNCGPGDRPKWMPTTCIYITFGRLSNNAGLTTYWFSEEGLLLTRPSFSTGDKCDFCPPLTKTPSNDSQTTSIVANFQTSYAFAYFILSVFFHRENVWANFDGPEIRLLSSGIVKLCSKN